MDEPALLVTKLSAAALGPLLVSVELEDGSEVDLSAEGRLSLSTQNEQVLRVLLLAAPSGVVAQDISTGSPYESVRQLKLRLEPVGLSVKQFSRRYHLTNLDGVQITIECDLLPFRDAARSAAETASEVYADRLEIGPARAALQECDAAFDCWRLEPGADDTMLPASVRHAAANCRMQAARLAVRFAEQVPSGPHLDRADIAVATLDDHGERARLRSRLTTIRQQLDEEASFDLDATQLFLAAPMAAASSYEDTRSLVQQLVSTLEDHCGFTGIYCALKDIETTEQFDMPSVSFEANWHPLNRANYFGMIWDEATPTGALVEAGLALAFGLSSVYFVRQGTDLPWILQNVGEAGIEKAPTVRVLQYADADDLVRKVRAQGRRLFAPPKSIAVARPEHQ